LTNHPELSTPPSGVREEGEIRPGCPLPLGAYLRDGGAQFAIFSRHATQVWLLLFNHPGDGLPARIIELDPEQHRTGDIWHVWVKGVKVGQLYGYRVDGRYNPRGGHRFNKHKLLLDPYATALSENPNWHFSKARGYDSHSPLQDLSFSTEDDTKWMPKCVLMDDHFDWQGTRPLNHPHSETIIYETHVRGLTIHPNSGVKGRGTFLGVIEKIPYFKELGITAVEFLPVQEFNENELEILNPATGEKLQNYWGYSTVSFLAPKASYSSRRNLGIQVPEFKEMVRELHKASIEVILDVVFNHTAEIDELGPTLCFRGLDNSIFYLLEEDKRFYKNYSGCGNTLNCNHPVVRNFIIDCLRYWVVETRVDGFRFDLASVMGRDEKGQMMSNPPILEQIADDPILRNTKLIAEAWDAAGAYQLGSFPGKRWSEWNGRYRDDVRRFWRGDPGMLGALASRICGSADLYQKSGKEPLNSINFITCHDGFTLNDLVCFKHKHNQANGEGNKDGIGENFSDNYGMEGMTDDPEIERIRVRQIKNFLATLFISRGIPLLLGGDEFRRSQQGNNNAYCQDNEVSWYNWKLLEKNREIFRFSREMIAFRKRHRVLRGNKFYGTEDILWFNFDGEIPDWGDSSQSLGCLLLAKDAGEHDLYLMFNADSAEKVFAIPRAPEAKLWYQGVNTSKRPPADIHEPGQEPQLEPQDHYLLSGRSMVILVSRSS
jgi:isoamylase